jgi:transcriptional regulator with GAF, ATPase, and Fis domain
VETNLDIRFDPAFVRDLLLEIGQERELDLVLKRLVDRIRQRPMVVAVSIWLVDKGDICINCPRRHECPDQTKCLHAAASSTPDLGTDPETQDPNLFSRIPLGIGVLGQVADTGQQMVLADLDQDPGEFASVPLFKSETIRGLNAVPISHKGQVLGVIGVFVRVNIPDEARMWARIFADYTGGSIANASAFKEIRQLKAALEQQNAYLQEQVIEARAFGDLVGQSAALQHIVNQIDLVAATDASVLILGETGTGKELVAHEIHRRSRRADKPLVRVNCASIPAELYESEFFGHVRGSFTGAIRDRTGRFETAEGGTLFLDEIGEIPLPLQGKLLRVLQEKLYERVGEDRTRRANVRIIGATNRDLKKEVAAGRFREDLYYRLNVFPIQVAPLRERRDDIPLLAQHFVHRTARDLATAKPRLTRAGIIQLQAYDWPGNIRELRNVVERAVILARGGLLQFDLPSADSKLPTISEASTPEGPTDDPECLTDHEIRQRERDNLLSVLKKAGWRLKGPGGAAELLGLKPSTLRSRITALNLRRPAKNN